MVKVDLDLEVRFVRQNSTFQDKFFWVCIHARPLRTKKKGCALV